MKTMRSREDFTGLESGPVFGHLTKLPKWTSGVNIISFDHQQTMKTMIFPSPWRAIRKSSVFFPRKCGGGCKILSALFAILYYGSPECKILFHFVFFICDTFGVTLNVYMHLRKSVFADQLQMDMAALFALNKQHFR